MLRSMNARTANYEATGDSHDRRQDHLNRRQVVKPKRDKPTNKTYLASVLFSTNAFQVDQSQGEIYNAAGTAGTGVVVYIDATSILGSQVPVIGGVYECTPMGKVTRSTTGLAITGNQTLWKALRLHNYTGNALSSPFFAPYGLKAVSATLATLTTGVGGSVVNTTLNGTAYPVTFPAIFPSGAAANYEWTMSQVQFKQSGTIPCAFPDIMLTGGVRGGAVSQDAGSGAALAVTGLTIEYGEVFDIELYLDYGPSNSAGAATRHVIRAKQTAAASYKCVGIMAGSNMKVTVAAGPPATGTTAVNAGNAQDDQLGATWTITMFSNVSTTTLNATVSFTTGSNGLTTGIGVTSITVGTQMAIMVRGGAPF